MNRKDVLSRNLRPEYELILACARTRLDQATTERIRRLVAGELDWPRLMQTALDHKVLPLVCANLAAANPPGLPQGWIDALRLHFEKNVRRNLYLTAQLVRLLDLFQSERIVAIAYKGPALTAQAYGNLGLRAFDDLDFLVPHRDLSRAHKQLLVEGFESEMPFEEGIAAGGAAPGQYLFWKDGGQCIVEVHTERTLRYYPKPLDVDGLLTRAVTVPLGGQLVPSFAPEDLLMILSVHASKHFWNRLIWVCDVAELVQLREGIRWDLSLEHARLSGCERMLFLGLYLAHDLLEAPLPDRVLRQVQASASVQALAAQVCKGLFRQKRSRPGVLQRFFFRSRMVENPWESARYCWRLATSPTEEDWKVVRLPAPLAPLYALLRPLRLIRKYGLGLVRRLELDLGPFVPTPPEIVDRVLEFAGLGPNDVLYDLGCGDGRIVVAAAKCWGILCVGVDVDPLRIAEAKARARAASVEHLVKFVQQDAKTADVSEATVVVLYLTLLGNLKLRERLQEQLRPGTRLVSRDFEIPGWPPERIERLEMPGGDSTTLRLWRMGRPEVPAADPERQPSSAPRTVTAGR